MHFYMHSYLHKILFLKKVGVTGVFPCIASADEETFGFTHGRGVWV
jgi:hypothetical protein